MTIRANLAYKILALILAMFVWFLARKSGEPIQMSFYAPVVFKNVSPSFQVTSNPQQVNIIAHTNSRESFNPLEIQAVLDLNKAEEGSFSYVLTEKDILSPVEVQIARIHPTQVTVKIEELIDRIVPVKLRYHGTPKKGYLLESIQVIPSSLALRGPRSVLEALDHISTQEVKLEGLKESVSIKVELDLSNKNVQIMDQNVDFYTAQVIIKSLPVKKRFNDVPVYMRNAEFVSVMNRKTFNVFVEGPVNLIENMQPSDLYGEIDLDNYQPGEYPKVTPHVVVPEGITVIQQWPIVSLWVKKEKISIPDLE